jgi:alkylmercury lyase-like protein
VWENRPIDGADLELRNVTYRLFVELGGRPSVDAVARALDADAESVRLGWQRLHEAHALVLDSQGELRMANPFSAVPTPHRVEAAGRAWYANCAWDAFGIIAAFHVDGRIDTTCPDCDEQLAVEVRDGRPDDEDLVFHSLVDAAHWWDDIVFT